MIEKSTPISWRPSEISVKNPAQSDGYVGNVVSWTNKSTTEAISEIRDYTSKKIATINASCRVFVDEIDNLTSKYQSLADIVDCVMNGNGLDPEDEGYLPSLQQAITDVYGEPPSNDP
jgi:hypothetical protein